MTGAPLTLIRLRDPGAQLEATFAPGAGMVCCSLRHDGDELLAQNAGVRAYAESGTTMGIPLLYPWANRLAAFDYAVAGRTVMVPQDRTLIALDDHGLPIHGVIGGRLEWRVTRPADSDDRSLSARLSWDGTEPQAFAAFPFRHEVHYEARLADGRLQIAVSVLATGQDEVPVAFGFHPYISPTGAPRERWLVELPAMRHLRLDAEQIPIEPDETLPARRFELADAEFDDGFDGLTPRARFAVSAGSRHVALEFLEGFPCAQVFAPRAAPFICFEPMTAPTNALRRGAGLPLLKPGDSYRAAFAVHVRRIS